MVNFDKKWRISELQYVLLVSKHGNTFCRSITPLFFFVFQAKTPAIVSGSPGGSRSSGESSGNLNFTDFVQRFRFCTPPTSMKILTFPFILLKTGPETLLNR